MIDDHCYNVHSRFVAKQRETAKILEFSALICMVDRY